MVFAARMKGNAVKPVMVKNTDKFGKLLDGKWFVRVGKSSRLFSQQEWAEGGIEWISKQLGG